MSSREQEKRKEKSEKKLKKLGSSFLPSLPQIESEDETILRSERDIGLRILCLVCVAAASDGVDKTMIIGWLKKENVFDDLSAEERCFLEAQETNQKDRTKFMWKSECIWLLLWSINKVKDDLPVQQCNINTIIKLLPGFGSSIDAFLKSIKLRNKSDILDMSDFLYRAHWATRQHQLDNETQIGKLDPDVVMEWHYAINWLTCYNGSDDWDDVSTDT